MFVKSGGGGAAWLGGDDFFSYIRPRVSFLFRAL